MQFGPLVSFYWFMLIPCTSAHSVPAVTSTLMHCELLSLGKHKMQKKSLHPVTATVLFLYFVSFVSPVATKFCRLPRWHELQLRVETHFMRSGAFVGIVP